MHAGRLDLWPARPRATLGDGTQVAVEYSDTEGVGGLEADEEVRRAHLRARYLLSATLVYNSLGSIDENAIGQLSFVAQLSRHVRFAPKDDASVTTATRPRRTRGGGEAASVRVEINQCVRPSSRRWRLRASSAPRPVRAEPRRTRRVPHFSLKPRGAPEISAPRHERLKLQHNFALIPSDRTRAKRRLRTTRDTKLKGS